MSGQAQCCGIGFQPAWEQESDGDYIFVSTCPKCGSRTECKPDGHAMQVLHRIITNGLKVPKAPAPDPSAAEVDPQEAADSALALRIMGEFKEWHRRADRTPQQIEAKLHECITRCQAEMKHPGARDKAVEGFGMMIGRIQEFTVEPEE